MATTNGSSVPECRGVYLLTHPRSASNLFQTMMAKQPGYQTSGYKLFDSAFPQFTQLPKGKLSGWPEDERKEAYESFRGCWEKLQDELDDAKKNDKKVFTKEHALFLLGPDRMYASVFGKDTVEPLLCHPRNQTGSAHTSPSCLPDEFLLSLQPIFQTRHPALMFPSMVRAQAIIIGGINLKHPMNVCSLTLRHQRELYDWYNENAYEGRKPRLIDADDIMNDPAAVEKLCVQTGMDPAAVQYEWEERHEEDPIKAKFLYTINSSRGIIKGLDAANIDIEKEKAKWKVEFGDESAKALAKFVQDAMPDYEYLRSQRTRSEPIHP